MSRRKLRHLSIVCFVCLFFLTKNILFLWILAFAVMAFSSSKTRRYSANRYRYEQDAESLGIHIPASREVHKKLIDVYKTCEASKKLQPELSKNFQEIIDKLWESLGRETDPVEWSVTLDKVLHKWPRQKGNIRETLEHQMDRVQVLSDQWAEARKEVFGKV